ncbi:MAG: hypothetical protein Q4C78_01440 [Synergistaceae bacterium]|nr:hypothetical protein [Synergistaceae bacterium]
MKEEYYKLFIKASVWILVLSIFGQSILSVPAYAMITNSTVTEFNEGTNDPYESIAVTTPDKDGAYGIHLSNAGSGQLWFADNPTISAVSTKYLLQSHGAYGMYFYSNNYMDVLDVLLTNKDHNLAAINIDKVTTIEKDPSLSKPEGTEAYGLAAVGSSTTVYTLGATVNISNVKSSLPASNLNDGISVCGVYLNGATLSTEVDTKWHTLGGGGINVSNIEASSKDLWAKAYGIYTVGNVSSLRTASDININGVKAGGTNEAYGMYMSGMEVCTNGSNINISSINPNPKDGPGTGLYLHGKIFTVKLDSSKQSERGGDIVIKDVNNVGMEIKYTTTPSYVIETGGGDIIIDGVNGMQIKTYGTSARGLKTESAKLSLMNAISKEAGALKISNINADTAHGIYSSGDFLVIGNVYVKMDPNKQDNYSLFSDSGKITLGYLEQAAINKTNLEIQLEGNVTAYSTYNSAENNIALANNNSYVHGNFVTEGNGVNKLYLSDGGRWLPVFDSTSHKSTDSVNVTLDKDGVIDVGYDSITDGKESYGREVTATTKRELNFTNLIANNSGGTIKVGTYLDAGISDTITVTSVAAGNNTLNIQIAYDPIFATLATGENIWSGTVDVFTATTGGDTISLVGKPTDYIFGNKIYRYTPTIAQNGNTWQIISLSAEKMVGYSLYEAINLKGGAVTRTPSDYDLETDVALGDGSEAGNLPEGVTSLGTLTEKDTEPRSFAINGNNHTLDGAGNGGIIVNSDDTLIISDLTVKEFNGSFVTNAGTLEFTGTNTMNNSVENNGVMNVTGETTFNSDYGVSGSGSITNTGLFTINVGQLGNTIENNKTLTLTGNGGTLAKDITGSGTTVINGAVVANANIANEITINSGKSLTTLANFLGGDVTVANNGQLYLTGNTLANAISGSGKTIITGAVTSDASIGNEIEIQSLKSLTISASNIGGNTTNLGTLTLLDGTLAKAVTGDGMTVGTTVIDGVVTSNVSIANAITINAEKSLTISAGNVAGIVTNNGALVLTDGTLGRAIGGTGVTTISGNVTSNESIASKTLAINNGSTLNLSASDINVADGVSNYGKLILKDGELKKAVNGAGFTEIDGTVKSNFGIANEITINNEKSLEISASNVGGAVTNAGTLSLLGGGSAQDKVTLAREVTGDGSTVINSGVVISTARIDNALKINENASLIALSNNLAKAVTNDGTLTILGRLVGQNVSASSDKTGTLNLGIGEKSFGTGVEIKNQNVTTSGILRTGAGHIDETDDITLNGGTIDITNVSADDLTEANANVVKVKNFNASQGTNKIVFNVKLTGTGVQEEKEGKAIGDSITVTGTASGRVNVADTKLNISNNLFAKQNFAYLQLFTGENLNGLTLVGEKVTASSELAYLFTADKSQKGRLKIEAMDGYTLYEAINLNTDEAKALPPDTYTLTEDIKLHHKTVESDTSAGIVPDDVTSLGILNAGLPEGGTRHSLTIEGDGHTLNGTDGSTKFGGVVVNSGDTLTLSNLTVKGFDGAFVTVNSDEKGSGTLEFAGTNNMYNSVENNGTMNVTGATTFASGFGVTGTGNITNTGSLTIGASNLGNTITNDGTLNLGAGALSKKVSGSGTTVINGAVTSSESIANTIMINKLKSLQISASNVGGAVTNDGKLTLTGTEGNKLENAVSGIGSTVIDGDIVSNAKIENKITINEGKSLKVSAENVGGIVTNEAGTLKLTGGSDADNEMMLNNIIMGEGNTIIDSGFVKTRKKIQNKITVGNGSAKTALAILADSITHDVLVNKYAQLDLIQGTLTHEISGNGVTAISRGDVKSEAKINTEIYIEPGRKFEISADNVGNTIHNREGTVILSDGTLNKEILDFGSLVIDGDVISDKAITNNITINDGKSLKISVGNIGGVTSDVTNNGTLTLTGKSKLGIGEPLAHRIKGSGKTIIAGNISSIAPAIGKISSEMIINGGKSLQIIASNIDGDIENNGKLEIYAYTTLLTNDSINNAITGSGTTSIKAKLTAKKEISTPKINIEDGELKISAGNVGGVVAISKNKKLVLTGGILRKEVSGSGTTEIDGSVISNASIKTKISINSGKSLSSLANYIGGTVSNSGTLTLTGDTLSHEVSGDGTTEIDGSVISNASIKTKISINSGKSLSSLANYIGGTVSNNGTLTLTGDTLNNAVSGSGKTVIDGTVTFNANVANAITINSGKSLTSSANYIGGIVANNEKLTLTGGTLNNAVAGSGSTVIGNGYVLSNALINNSINLSVAQSSLEISADNIGAGKAVTGVGNLYLTGGTLTTQGIGTQATGENVKTHITGNVVSNEKIYGQSLSISDSPSALLAISAENICISDSLVTNNGTLNLTGGTLAKAVNGSGTTEIDGAVTFNANVANAITVNDGKSLTSSANYLGVTVSNSGTLTLTGDTLNNAVSGSGETVIDGTVTFDANVANAITINGGKSLTSSANYIGRTVSNSGNLTLGDGTLKNAVNGSGETVIDGDVTSTASISNAITINSDKTLTISAENVGANVTNDGTLTLFGEQLSKNVTATNRGTLNLTLGEKTFADGITLTNQDICVTSLGILKAGKDHINTTDNVTLKNGTIDITNGSAIALTEHNANVVEINDFSAKDGTNRIVFNTKVSKTLGTAKAISDSIKVAGTVTAGSTLNIAATRANIANAGTFGVGDEAIIDLFVPAETGNISNLKIVGKSVTASADLSYVFSAVEGAGNEGKVKINAEEGCTLYEAINLNTPRTEYNLPTTYSLTADTTLGTDGAGVLPEGATSLGTLNDGLPDEKTRETFTILGNGKVLSGNAKQYGGITVNEGDTLILSDLTVKEFKDNVFLTNAGTLEFNDTNTMESSVINNGAMNVTGATTFASGFGVSGDGVITNTSSLTIGASNLGNETTNNGTLTLKDGTLESAVSGDGQTIIDGAVTSNKLIANAITISSSNSLGISANNIGGRVTNEAGTLTLSDGTLNYAVSGAGSTVVDGYVIANTRIANAITVNEGKSLKISAGHVAGDVTNSGTLTLSGGILKHTVTGNNTNSSTVIDGIVISTANIDDKITINTDKRLVISADKVGGDFTVTNNGKLSLLDGTLGNAVEGSGETIIAGDVISNEIIENEITINSGKSLNISADNIGGDVTNKGTLTLEGDTLSRNVSGNGSTVIAGAVMSDASIGNTITIAGSNSLTISASSIGGVVTNDAGTLTLSNGELAYAVKGNGSTKIDGDIISSAIIGNTITINNGKSLTISANYVGNTVTNEAGTLTLTDGTLAKAVSGNGSTIIDGTVTSDKNIANKITINATKSLAISAGNVDGAVTNDGTLILSGGSLAKTVSGSGVTIIDGAVTSDKNIANKITINSEKSLKISANNVGGVVTNDGMLTLLGGTLANEISGNGETVINGVVTSDENIANAIEIKGSNSLKISANNIGGIVTNTAGTLTLSDGKLRNAVTGTGRTVINGDVISTKSIANAITILAEDATAGTPAGALTISASDVAGDVTNNATLTLKTGTLNKVINGGGSTVVVGTVRSTASIANAIKIYDRGSLEILADNVDGDVVNNGTLTLLDGILTQKIEGNGTTVIDGVNVVSTAAKIANEITINSGKTLYISANDIGGDVTNNGTLRLSGADAEILNNTVTGNGATVIDGTIVARKSIENAITVSSDNSLTISAENVGGDVTNDGTLNLTGKMLSYDVFASENKRGTLKFVGGEKSFDKGVKVTNQDIEVSARGKLNTGAGDDGTGQWHLNATDNVTLKNGTINITNGSAEEAGNVVKINSFTADKGINKIVFNTILSTDATKVKSDSINVAGNVTIPSNVKIDITSANIYNDGSFTMGSGADISLFTGNVTGLTLVGGLVVESPDIAYNFTTTDTAGQLHIQATEGCTLYGAINLTLEPLKANPPTVYSFTDDVILGVDAVGYIPSNETSLGTLNGDPAVTTTRDTFTINGNGHTLNGAGYGGVEVNNGDTLTLSNLTVTGFNGDFVTNAGTVEFAGTNNMFASVKNNGKMTVTGTVVFNSGFGISGIGSIENSGSMAIEANGLGADIANITNDAKFVLYGTGSLAKEINGIGQTIIGGDITSNVAINNSILINSNRSLTIAADNIGGTVINDGILILTGNNKKLAHEVDGEGKTVISGNITSTVLITNTMTINDAKSLKISASNVCGSVVNNAGTLILTDGTLNHTVMQTQKTGTGHTVIAGDVLSNAIIANAIRIQNSKSLEISASKVGGEVTVEDGARLTLSNGNLIKNISGNGSTIIAGSVASVASIATKNLAINSDSSLETAADNIQTTKAVANKGTLTITGGTSADLPATLMSGVDGNGLTVIAGNVTASKAINNEISIKEGKSLAISATNVGNVVINDGTLILTGDNKTLNHEVSGYGETVIAGSVTSDALIANVIKITQNNSLAIAAGNVGGAITNNGTLTLGKGLLKNAVNGNGTTEIDGTVVSSTKIANAVTINNNKSLAISASNVDGDVTNEAGKLILSDGTLEKNIIGAGNIIITGDVAANGAITNQIAILSNKSLTISAGNVYGTIANDGILTLFGTGTLGKAINGGGSTIINGAVSSTVSIANTITINNTRSLVISASNVGGVVTNEGTLTLADGTLTNAVTGSGKTVIDGDVESSAKIANTIAINAAKSLATSANNVGGDVTNDGTLTLSKGMLEKTINGSGLTVIDGNVVSTAKITNDVTVNEDKSLDISAGNLNGDVTNYGALVLSDGTLVNTVTGNGVTEIVGDVKSDASIANQIRIRTNKSLEISASNVSGDVTNEGTLKLFQGTLKNALTGSGETLITEAVVSAANIATNKITISDSGSLVSLAKNLGSAVTNDGILDLIGTQIGQNVSASIGKRGNLHLGIGVKSFKYGVTVSDQDIVTMGTLRTGKGHLNETDSVTLIGGTIDISEGSARTAGNIVTVKNFTALTDEINEASKKNEANKIMFNTKLYRDGNEGAAINDSIDITGTALGTMKFASLRSSIYNDGTFKINDEADIDLFTGNVSNLTLIGGTVVNGTDIAYRFAAIEGEGNEGKLHVKALEGCTLYGAINLSKDTWMRDDPPLTYVFLKDVTLGKSTEGILPVGATSLGTLTRNGQEARDFTIDGGGYTLNGASFGGVKVNEGDTLRLSNLTVTGFEGASVMNAGAVEFADTINMQNSVVNDGIMTVTGTTTFASGFGVSGNGSILNTGSLTIEANELNNTVTNNGTLTLFGTGTLEKAINGDGSTIIDGAVTFTASIANTITINNTRSLVISASNVGGVVTNEGTLTLADGTLTNAVTGSGKTVIDGDVESSAKIANTIAINAAKSLATSANNVGGDVTNDGTLTLSKGMLEKTINGSGLTVIDGNVVSTAKITNDVTVNEDKSLDISAGNLNGDVTNYGALVLSDGTLVNTVTGNGVTEIVGDVKSDASIANQIRIRTNKSLEISASNVSGDVTNEGTLKLFQGTLKNALTGSGETLITEAVVSAANIATNKITISDSGSLVSLAKNLGSAVTNDGILDLIGTQIGQNVSASIGKRGNLHLGIGVKSFKYGVTVSDQDIVTMGTLRTGKGHLNETDSVTLIGGTIDISEGSARTAGNIVTVKNFTALTDEINEASKKNEANKIMFNTKLYRDGNEGAAINDSIDITGTALGTMKFASLRSSIYNDGTFKINDEADIDLFTGNVSNLTLIGGTVVNGTDIAYRFAAIEGEGNEGKLHVKALEGCTLYGAINLSKDTWMRDDPPLTYVFLKDVTLGKSTEGILPVGATSLGTLTRNGQEARDFTIDGGGYTLNGASFGGVKVNEGDTLRLSNLTVTGFEGASVMNAGAVEFADTINMQNSVVNDGIMTVTGTTTFASGFGVSGNGSILNTGSLTIEANELNNTVTNDGTLTLNGGTLTKLVKSSMPTENGDVQLKSMYGVTLDAQLSNQNIIAAQGYSRITQESYMADNDLTFNGGGFDFQDNKVISYVVRNINLLADGYLKLDVDLAAKKMDNFDDSVPVTIGNNGKLHITALTLLTEASGDVTKVLFTSNKALASAVSYDGDTRNLHVASHTQAYMAGYDKEKGEFTFTKVKGAEASETTMSLSDTVNAINLAWLESVNNLQKRLGDLRSGEESNTGWMRFQRSLDDLNMGRKLNVSGNLYQIGYDVALKNDTTSRGYLGLSFEHMDGNQSFKIGGGDLESTSLGVYYTKIYNTGHYFDFILRYGKYDSDTTSYDTGIVTKLDYAMNGVTLSGEYGYRANLGKNGFYLEPQVELIYGYLSGAKKTSSAAYVADIDSTNHFITRWGIALGQRVSNINYYLNVNYYHDFAGSASVTYGDASYKQDGAHNWWEVSLGGGWQMGKASYFYAELVKHYKDISNSVNFNLGFRFTL